MDACSYCGADVWRHDPVFVETAPTRTDRTAAGHYCNYACLAAHIDDAALADGDACAWDG